MKACKYIKNILVVSLLLLVSSCEKSSDSNITGRLVDVTEDFIQGDSVYLTVEIEGGNPPFAFRYSWMDDNAGKRVYRNVYGFKERNHTFSLLLGKSTTIRAESVACYYENTAPAEGTATFKMLPVEYVYAESLPASKTGFLHKAQNKLNFAGPELQLKSDGSNNDRRVFFEFDAAEIINKKEKSNYIFNFWIVNTHSQGINAGPALMDVGGWLGALNDEMKWDDQPADIDVMPLLQENFRINSANEKLLFSVNINKLVYKALENPSSNKFTIRIREYLNDFGNKGYYFLGGNLYSDPEYRPKIDVLLREIIN